MKRLSTAGLLLLLTGAAHAQYDAGATVGLGQGMLLNNSTIGSDVMGDVILRQGRRTAGPGAGGSRGRSAVSEASLAALQFHPSAEVSRSVLDRIARQFGGRQPDAYRQALVRDGVLARFDGLLRQLGYDSHDVADAYTAYLVLSWEVVNNGDAMQYRSGIDALRRSMRQALARTPRFTSMTDAQKQEMAETFGYLAMIAVATRDDLRRKGDEAGLSRLRDGVTGMAQRMGVNLRAIKMTPQGFVAL
ncbi:DUF6683 family protein [Inquilinus limosus]|uniref:DUF6683 family protein n=1 Tax=Inquilinus limosus TaxID=171674 RepID=UPI00068D0622|nr:DUF6683 family protein [Inquilinus limosus]